MADAPVLTKKNSQQAKLSPAELDNAARGFADELINKDYSQSKYLPEQVKKFETDKHLSVAACDYLARRIAADNDADRQNTAQEQRQQVKKDSGVIDWLKGVASNDHLEKNKILPKVILGGPKGHAQISGVMADVPYEKKQDEVVQASTPKPAPPHPQGDYPDTAIGQERVFTDTLNLNKK